MKVEYYKDRDFLYLELSDRPQMEGQEISDGITAHYGAAGEVVALEIDRASERADMNALHALGIKDVHIEAA